MNILILSAGRRTKLVEHFKTEFHGTGKVVATDCDSLAPALYCADCYYIVPPITHPDYIACVLDICRKEHINGVISLIDPELELIAGCAAEFEKAGIQLYISPCDVCRICFDKFEMFNFLKKNGFRCAKTYIDIEEFKRDFKRELISFPVFIKPRCGSASLGISIVYEMRHLELLFQLTDNLIIQEFLRGDEYGADCYIDLLSHQPVSIFVKKKIRMRAGETDKAVSVLDGTVLQFIQTFAKVLGAAGPIDIDLFKINEQWYISEVNPRFGGGYPHAYACGCNFPLYIRNNMQGIINQPIIGNYQDGVVMMKHDTVMIREDLDKEMNNLCN